MHCSTCSEKFIEFEYKGLRLDICPKCNRLWFDRDELRKAKDAKDEFLRWVDLDLWKDKGKFRITQSPKLCPRDAVPLYETRYDTSDIIVDVCSVCEGVLLDKGEFDKIIICLQNYVSDENIRSYLKDIGAEVLEMFNGPEGFSSEAKDLLMVIKLLTYRIGVQVPILAEIIRQLPK